MSRIALAGLAALLLAACDSTPATDVPLRLFKPIGELREEKVVGRYTIRTYRNKDGEGSFEILRDGRRICGERGARFTIDSTGDLNGDRVPELAISHDSGGAHCCHSVILFELGPVLRYIQTVDGQDATPVFLNADGDPGQVIALADMTFAYWHECFARSPAASVVLKYNGRKWVPCPDLMRQPPPSDQQLRKLAAGIAAMDEWGPRGAKAATQQATDDFATSDQGQTPSRLWGEMLDLIYSGNADVAWRLCDLAWASPRFSQQTFLREFKAQLARSPYWPVVQKMNRTRTPSPPSR